MPKIGLVSFPGSGNTWTRYLIESLTGVFTGSVYTASISAIIDIKIIISDNFLTILK